MKLLYRYIFIILIFSVALQSQAQVYQFGVRAGLDFSTLIGPTETHETLGFNNGFHFGMNINRVITSRFGIQLEVMYAQKGYSKTYQGQGFYPIRDLNNDLFYFPADIDYQLEISNTYVTLPLGVYFRPWEKLEIGGGIAASFMINPRGGGTVDITSRDEPTRIFFRQNLNYNYYQNVEEGISTGFGSSGSVSPQVFIGDDIVTVPSSVGAYYFNTRPGGLEPGERAIKGVSWIDMSTWAYARFYINKSFYFGVRGEYGFIDVTRQEADYSLESLSSDNQLKFNSDTDLNLNIQASVGFKF